MRRNNMISDFFFQTVMELQKKLPKARIVYASATGATEPRHMAYMVRLGIWGEGSPFRDFGDFLAAVEKRYVFLVFKIKMYNILFYGWIILDGIFVIVRITK